MNHTIMPVTAQGEPIPLVKLGQGREGLDEYQRGLAKDCLPGDYHQGNKHESGPLETPQTFAEKLRKAGYQEPVLPKTVMDELLERRAEGLAERAEAQLLAEIPLVSQRGFKAGVFATCLGGAFLGALFFGCGALICGCVAAGCVGFVAGMLMTEEWK